MTEKGYMGAISERPNIEDSNAKLKIEQAFRAMREDPRSGLLKQILEAMGIEVNFNELDDIALGMQIDQLAQRTKNESFFQIFIPRAYDAFYQNREKPANIIVLPSTTESQPKELT